MGNKKSKVEEYQLSSAEQLAITTSQGNRFILTSSDDVSRLVIFFLRRENSYLYREFEIKVDSIYLEANEKNPMILFHDILINAIRNLRYWPKDIIIVTDCRFGDTILANLMNCGWPGVTILIDPDKEEELQKHLNNSRVIVYHTKQELYSKSQLKLRMKLDIHRHLKLL